MHALATLSDRLLDTHKKKKKKRKEKEKIQ